MSKFRRGDRVSIAYTGTVQNGDSKYLHVETDDGESYSPHTKHAKLLEPEYQPGHVYVDTTGTRYFRLTDGYWIDGGGRRWAHTYPQRPLARAQ